MTRVATTAAGWLAGSLVGCLEGALRLAADPGWGFAALPVGCAAWGSLGALAGLAISYVAPLTLTRRATLQLAAAALTLHVGAGLAPLLWQQPGAAPLPGLNRRATDVLWIVADGLKTPPDGRPDPAVTPRLAGLAEQAVTFAWTFAPSTDPHVALASLLTGRLPPAAVPEPGAPLPPTTPTVASVLRDNRYDTSAWLQGDASLASGFTRVVRGRPARVFGLDPVAASVWPIRLLDALVGPTGPARHALPAREVVAGVDLSARTEGRPSFDLVHLADLRAPEAMDSDEAWATSAAEVDAAIGQLLDGLAAAGRLETTLVVVTGSTGARTSPPPNSDGAQELSSAETRVLSLARFPEEKWGGFVFYDAGSTISVGPSITTWAADVDQGWYDGRAIYARIEKSWRHDRHLALMFAVQPAPDPEVGIVPERRDALAPPPSANPTAPIDPPPAPGPKLVHIPRPGLPPPSPDSLRAATPPPAEVKAAPTSAPIAPDAGRRGLHDRCDVLHAAFGPEAAVSVRTEVEGSPWLVIRADGYSLHLPGATDPAAASTWRLYDLTADPTETGRPHAREAITCHGLTARERAAQLQARLADILAASAAGRDRPAPPPLSPPEATGSDMPDPAQARKGR